MFFTDSYRAMRRGERGLAVRYFVISVLIIALIGLPLGFFMLRRFEASVIFHPERVIPVAQGRKLFEAAPEPRRLIIIERAGHNDLPNVGGGKYIDSLAEF